MPDSFGHPLLTTIMIIKYPAVVLALVLIYCATGYSQQSREKTEPKTQLEAFGAETGAVIIKGYSEIGNVIGEGKVEVDCREFTNAKSGTKSYGIVIRVVDAERGSSSSFVDADEIPSLLAGIDYISKIQPSVTKLKNFEATYTTKGDFAATVYNRDDGRLSAVIKSGNFGSSKAFFQMPKLLEVRALILKAKVKLDEIQK